MSAGGGRFELNLTPYIDLMSTLIVFLLMTAVWNQISMLSTEASSTTSSDQTTNLAKKQIILSLNLYPEYLELMENQSKSRIPHLSGQINRKKLDEALKTWKQRYPEKKDVILNSENTVTYKMLINAFDELVGHNFPDVGVNTQ